MRLLLSSVFLCAFTACASAPQAAESTSDLVRFRDPDHITVAPDDSLPRPLRTNVGPRYPADARAAGLTTALVVAFVVDTAGRAELGSASFVQPASHPDFHTAICDFLRVARFVPSRKAETTRRALVFMPFQFSLGLPDASPPPQMTRYESLMRETPPRELFAMLERYPHC